MSENTSRSLVRKLSEVMAAIERVAKSGRNEFHKYDYAKEADLVEAVRDELAKRQIFIFPDTTSHTQEGDLTTILVAWTFEDGESGETRTCRIPGTGQDKGDKGVYKALTGSEKYLLMKAFLIPTGDDPEKDSEEDRHVTKNVTSAAKSAPRSQSSSVSEQPRPAAKPVVPKAVIPKLDNPVNTPPVSTGAPRTNDLPKQQVLPSAADLDAVSAEQKVTASTAESTTSPADPGPIPVKSAFDTFVAQAGEIRQKLESAGLTPKKNLSVGAQLQKYFLTVNNVANLPQLGTNQWENTFQKLNFLLDTDPKEAVKLIEGAK